MALIDNELVVNNSERNFYQELQHSFGECQSFDFTVAFINLSGLQLLLDSLKMTEEQSIPGRIITSTYLNFTEPKALRKLKAFSNIDLKIFEIQKNIGFHTKAYIFQNPENLKVFVGSSNITQSALKSNKEWNVKIQLNEKQGFGKSITDEFELLWNVSIPADDEFLDSYEEFYNDLYRKRAESPVFELKREFRPNLMQVTALENFRRLREQRQSKAIAIAATGSGKTIMAALDVKMHRPGRVCFSFAQCWGHGNLKRRRVRTKNNQFYKHRLYFNNHSRRLSGDFVWLTQRDACRRADAHQQY